MVVHSRMVPSKQDPGQAPIHSDGQEVVHSSPAALIFLIGKIINNRLSIRTNSNNSFLKIFFVFTNI